MKTEIAKLLKILNILVELTVKFTVKRCSICGEDATHEYGQKYFCCKCYVRQGVTPADKLANCMKERKKMQEEIILKELIQKVGEIKLLSDPEFSNFNDSENALVNISQIHQKASELVYLLALKRAIQ